MLYNILLVHDGYDSKFYAETFWDTIDPMDDDNEDVNIEEPIIQDDLNTININSTMNYGVNYKINIEIQQAMIGYKFRCGELGFQNKIDALIISHHQQFIMGRLLWPKSYPKMRKKHHVSCKS